MTATVLLVGARGFGAVHLRNLERLGDRVELIGVADPKGAPDAGFGSTVPGWPSLDAALSAGARPDVVIVATPTNTHFALAERALDRGSDVYLEKPPVASVDQFHRLSAVQERTGRAVQVGFQSFGSHALDDIARLGRPTSVAAWAAWTRDLAYWRRSPWAGRRTLDGAPVVDGVLTNPLSHAIATALRIAGARHGDDVASVELDQYRANDIEADDTSSIRITLADGRLVSAALALTSRTESAPLIEVRTPDADVVFSYTEDELMHADGSVTRTGRTDLFEQLLDHRETGVALSSPLAESGAFLTVMEAVRLAPDAARIPAAELQVSDEGPVPLVIVPDVAAWTERTARAGALFRELRAPFAVPAPPGRTDELRLGDRTIAVRDDGSTTARTSGPRPFLHPVRTLGGVTVTDAHPADHDWHLGVSVALQDVGGTNFWGGPTYTRASDGYRWLSDEGRIEQTSCITRPGGLVARARWIGHDGAELLSERTEWEVAAADDPRAWTFRTATTLRAGAGSVALGGPGSNGRAQSGYGGFFWRLPAAQDVHVRTEHATGEHAVHGSVSSWLAFSARLPEGEATVAIAGDDERTRRDPWFVRVSDYPGIGSALAWDRPAPLAAGASMTLSFRGVVADGILTDDEIAALLSIRGR